MKSNTIIAKLWQTVPAEMKTCAAVICANHYSHLFSPEKRKLVDYLHQSQYTYQITFLWTNHGTSNKVISFYVPLAAVFVCRGRFLQLRLTIYNLLFILCWLVSMDFDLMSLWNGNWRLRKHVICVNESHT
jgi:uncharacterized membrane protein YqaE (UPF0057 family)